MQIDLSPLHNLPNGGLQGTDLTDGRHVIVTCPKCRKSLCDAWITQPQVKLKTKLKAKCDYCGTEAVENIVGKCHIGGTDDSGMIDIKHTFLDGPSPSDGFIYEIRNIVTKRLK